MEVKKDILTKVIEYMTHYKDQKPAEIEKVGPNKPSYCPLSMRPSAEALPLGCSLFRPPRSRSRAATWHRWWASGTQTLSTCHRRPCLS